MKETFCTAVGLAGGCLARFFGGFDAGFAALGVIMGIDYLTGVIVAGIFKKSPHTETGGLESRTGLKGLIRKFVMLLIVAAAYRIDIVAGSAFVRDSLIIAFIANETISVMENAGLMGIEIPVLKDAIELLRKKNGEKKG